MKLQGAVVKEQGVTFAIVVVKRNVIQSQHESQEASKAFSPYFPGLLVVLMAQDSRATPTYWGRDDIVASLAQLDISQIPWKEYTFT